MRGRGEPRRGLFGVASTTWQQGATATRLAARSGSAPSGVGHRRCGRRRSTRCDGAPPRGRDTAQCPDRRAQRLQLSDRWPRGRRGTDGSRPRLLTRPQPRFRGPPASRSSSPAASIAHGEAISHRDAVITRPGHRSAPCRLDRWLARRAQVLVVRGVRRRRTAEFSLHGSARDLAAPLPVSSGAACPRRSIGRQATPTGSSQVGARR